MNEPDTRAEWIDPLLKAAGWGVVKNSKIQREFHITQKAKVINKADYLLIFNNTKLAIVEAKRLDLPAAEGVSQAKIYAEKLQLRFAYATNGKTIYQIDLNTGKEGEIAQFPSPSELWQRTFAHQNTWRDQFAQVSLENKSGSWEAYYYQEIAINRILEAIAQEKSRILLTLATGTGKTAIAFQVAWKLFHSRWNLKKDQQRRPRILFLADRNILADQAYNAFSAFPEDALIRIKPDDIRKKGKVPTNGNIFLTIFQTFMSGKDNMPYFGEYPSDFFDLVIIDECHRGGADDESNWRGILDYFSPAVQLGLTATPKRQGNTDTYQYFGEPVYSYSLKEGINDGFLTPFKIKQIQTTLDDYSYTSDDHIIAGEVIAGKIYKESEFNQTIEIEAREAKRVQIFMKDIDQNEKTLVFCAHQLHASLIRDLINQTKQSCNIHYCERVTADEGERGEQFLRDFQDNEKTIPTILTTSRKLSTGVDARNVRNIVLLRPIKSMIEFKQIIGRGTRLYDGKDYFTIYDFVKAYHHFEDPEWDGEPLDKTVEKKVETVANSQIKEGINEYHTEKNKKVIIRLADGKERLIQHTMSTSFWSADGQPLSSKEFLEQLFGQLPKFFKSEDELRAIWSQPATRKDFLTKIAELGYGKESLTTLQKIIDAEKSDLYDVLAYVAFGTTPMSRVERVATKKDYILAHFDDQQQAFLEFVLKQYIETGIDELDQDQLPHLLILKYHTIPDATAQLGQVETIKDTFVEFQSYLYECRAA